MAVQVRVKRDEIRAEAEQERPNPLREGLRQERVPDPAQTVIFGATGDLTKKKLMPALFTLFRSGQLPPGSSIVGVGRTQQSTDDFRNSMKVAITEANEEKELSLVELERFLELLYYVPMQIDNTKHYQKLAQILDEIDKKNSGSGNKLFYMATPPSAFTIIVEQLGIAGLARETGNGWRRVVVEKPFGHDLASARELNRRLTKVFSEDQIFRIDHYLGKETVQNILVFRFANSIFEPIWSGQYIDHVQITVAEDIGVEGRGSYYEEAGALRDMVQNHALQLLCLVAMESPVGFDARSVRDEKVKVLRAVRKPKPEDVNLIAARGQYGAGWIAGKRVVDYRSEEGVSPNSTTETYAAVKLELDDWRWGGTPFYIRTGKRLPKRATEIAIEFKRPPYLSFGREALEVLDANLLVLRIQPEEGISLRFRSKVPSPGLRIRSVSMDFHYGASFGGEILDAYERLLLDCLLGDATLFTRVDEVESAWSIIDPIEEGWAMHVPDFPNYEAGTWGPKSADILLARDGRVWRQP